MGETSKLRLNLMHLLRRLERSVEGGEWSDGAQDDVWISTRGTLRKVQYAEQLLMDLKLHDTDTSLTSAQQYQDIGKRIQRVEQIVQALEKRTAPEPTRPEPLLPKIVPPLVPPTLPFTIDTAPLSPPLDSSLLLPVGGSIRSEDMFSSVDSAPLPPVPGGTSPLLPQENAAANNSNKGDRVIDHSNTLQSELASELASMAVQLRRNAIHFSESLEKDHSVVTDAQEKMENNFESMKKERTRLRDHSADSRGMTCLVLLSLLTVSVLFTLMIFIIRWV